MFNDGSILRGCRFDISGNGNQIHIGNYGRLRNVHVKLVGSGHRLELSDSVVFDVGGCLWFEDDGGSLVIERDVSIQQAHIAVTEGCRVRIGEGCLIGNDVDIRTGDSHAVVDQRTGERVNMARDVVLGARVWVAAHVRILKGVFIGDDSVVATGAVVTKDVPPNTVVGGVPAVVIKEAVEWRRNRV